MISRALLALLLLLCAGCTSTPRPADAPSASPRARWTWMVYMDANNDLESEELNNLKEMMKVGSTPDVNVIVLCARSPEHDEELGYSGEAIANLQNWTTCKLLRVEKGRLLELEDWGAVNMADGRTLARFLETATKKYPAERYLLNLNDHGLGWPGCCGDETIEQPEEKPGVPPRAEELLTPQALRDAMSRGPRLEIIGFDACLMASLEVARIVSPCAKYMVASEEMEPSSGWSYEPTLKYLAEHPDVDGAALGRRIADDFIASLPTDEEGLGATLSVIDLSRVEPVAAAMDDLAASCSAELEIGRAGWIHVARARSRSEEYGKSDEQGEESSEVYDIVSFASEAERQLPRCAPAARRVREAMRLAVPYSVHGEGRADAHGLSIFLPRHAALLNEPQPLTYAQTVGQQGSRWLAFLRAYTAVTDRQKSRPFLSPVKKSVSGSTVTLTAKTGTDDIEAAWFVLAQRDEKSTMIIGQIASTPAKNGKLEESWDGRWFALTNGDKHLVCPITTMSEVKEDTYTVQVPADLKRPNWKQWHDATLHFYVTYEKSGGVSGKLMYAFEETKYGPRQITLQKGDLLRPVFLEIDPDGTEVNVVSDDAEDQLRITRTNGLAVGYEDIDPGTYRAGFVVKDFADNRAQQLVDVEVK